MRVAGRRLSFDLSAFADALGAGRLFAIAVVGAAVIALMLTLRESDHLFHLDASTAEAFREDLPTAYAAGVMAREGRYADAYDPALFREAIGQPETGIHWLNPPHAVLLAAPLSLLSYEQAKALTLLTSVLAAWLVAAAAGLRRTEALLVAVVAPAVFVSLFLLQVGIYCAGLLLAGLVLSQRRLWLAGFALAILTMKPQYGVLAPVFLIALGRWPAVGATIVWTLALLAATYLFVGGAPFAAFVDSLATVQLRYAGYAHPGSTTVAQTLGKLGVEAVPRTIAVVLVLVTAIAVVWRAARRLDEKTAVALTLVLSLAAAPSAWAYDFYFVTLGLLMLAQSRPQWPVSLQLLAAAAWFAPLGPWLLGGLAGSVAPGLVLLATAALAARHAFRGAPA